VKGEIADPRGDHFLTISFTIEQSKKVDIAK
jgi:hypothetical protein